MHPRSERGEIGGLLWAFVVVVVILAIAQAAGLDLMGKFADLVGWTADLIEDIVKEAKTIFDTTNNGKGNR